MQGWRQFGSALTIALLSVGLVLGGLSLALVEYARPAALGPTEGLPASPIPLTATATLPPPLQSQTPSSTPLPTATPPPPASCPIPSGWIGLTVQPGETLDVLATRYRTTSEQLRQGNCLSSNSLVVNAIVYVPNVSPSTAAAANTIAVVNTTVGCTPGAAGWTKNYVVQVGDTLFHIATQYFTDTATLKRVNCRSRDQINPGEVLWVPNRATRTPTATLPSSVNTPIPTEPLTLTALPFTLTPEPTDTVAPATATASATTAPTITPSLTAFPTNPSP